MNREKILVVGSSNTDVILRIPRYPLQGESLVVYKREQALGGKGSNRAVALTRLGADLDFCCKLGKDASGEFILDAYEKEGVSREMVLLGDTEGTGTAYIMLEDSGSNTILSYLGANGDYTQKDIDVVLSKLSHYGYLCMDLEFSLEAIRAILKASKEGGPKAVIDAGPVRKELPLDAFRGAYVLSPNETEASGMTGIKITDRDSAEKACAALYQSGCENVILKWGKQGALLYDGTDFSHFPAYSGSGKVVDTTAAGDCFMAGLTCRPSEGYSLKESIQFANIAASIAVTRLGAIPSLPNRKEVELMAEKAGQEGYFDR